MKSHKYIKLHWRDAASEEGWTNADSVDYKCVTIESVGIFVGETKDTICLAVSWDEVNDCYASVWYIPKDWIIQRKWIRA